MFWYCLFKNQLIVSHIHGSKHSDKRNSKEIETKRSATRMSEHTDNKKQPAHPKTNQNHNNSCWSPCLSLLIFPLISEVCYQCILIYMIQLAYKEK